MFQELQPRVVDRSSLDIPPISRCFHDLTPAHHPTLLLRDFFFSKGQIAYEDSEQLGHPESQEAIVLGLILHPPVCDYCFMGLSVLFSCELLKARKDLVLFSFIFLLIVGYKMNK